MNKHEEENTVKKDHVQPFLIITSDGYWGKGDTALEAAKNAKVKDAWVHAGIWKANEHVDGEISCDGNGSPVWKWKEALPPAYSRALNDALIIGSGRIKITKDKLVLEFGE
jgi:hypothetical protein